MNAGYIEVVARDKRDQWRVLTARVDNNWTPRNDWAAQGFSGPCGLDAFAFRSASGGEAFRPVVEWNARFNLGTLAIGHGKVDEAVERLERYLSMSPEDGQNKATAEGLLQALKK